MIAAMDWTPVLVALIAGLPGIIAAVFAGLVHRQVKTPSGNTLGYEAERSHHMAAANNLLLRNGNGPTKQATPEELQQAIADGPAIPASSGA